MGLGSMGRRRIRNLRYLGYKEIVGFDLFNDRCLEAKKSYGITIAKDYATALGNVDAVIISTPPDSHGYYALDCVKNRVPCFMENNTFDWGVDGLSKFSEKHKVLVAPSCTLRHYSLVKIMKRMVDKHELGKPLAFTSHSGQHLLEWHPWEGLNFYMSDKNMGGIFETVSFDLTWITWLFGYPLWQEAKIDKVSNLQADIYDICQLVMGFEGKVIGHFMADLFSRLNDRSCTIFCEEGNIVWKWGEGLYSYGSKGRLLNVTYPKEVLTQKNYSEKIKEEPYIEELSDFIRATKGEIEYPYNLEHVKRRLSILKAIKEQNQCTT